MQVSDRIRAITDGVSKRLADEGKLIEAGWHAYRTLLVPASAGVVQVEETRLAFFAGAQHLFGSINSIMEDGEEPTDKDLKRMDQINEELAAFADDLAARTMPAAKGSA